MKITFLQDHQSYLSGNSFYTTGTKADLPRGGELVELGIAAEGWGAPAPPESPVQPVEDERIVEDVTVVPSLAESVDFTVVRGISDEAQAALYNAGYLTWEDILQAGVIEIKDNVSSVGMARARALFAMAQKEA